MGARKFGEAPAEVLEFEVAGFDGTFKLPLLTSMPLDEAEEYARISAGSDEDAVLAAFQWQRSFLRKHCGDTLADGISVGTCGEIFAAWVETNEDTGVTPGE